MRHLAVAIAMTLLPSCKHDQPPPILGHVTPQLLDVLKNTCGAEFVAQDYSRGYVHDGFFDEPRRRLASRPLVDPGCRLSSGELSITYDEKTGELFKVHADVSTKADAGKWLDVLRIAGLDEGLVAQARAQIAHMPETSKEHDAFLFSDHDIRVVVSYGQVEPAGTVHWIDAVVER